MKIFKKLLSLTLSLILTINTTVSFPVRVFSDEIIEEIPTEYIDESYENEDVVETKDEEETTVEVEEDTIDEESSEDEITEEVIEEENVEDDLEEVFEEEVIEDEEILEEVDINDDNDDFVFVPGYHSKDVDVDSSLIEESSKPLLTANNLSAIPASYNLNDVGGVTSVKSQGSYGTCWAHAVLASAESTSIMQGEATKDIDLSELNLAYFEYNNHYADKLGLITNDYSYSDNNETNGEDNVINEGGNLELAMFNLPSGIGFSYESRLPYSVLPSPSNFNINSFRNTYINEDWCYDNDFLLINVDTFNFNNRNTIKEQLMANGAMAVSYYHDDSYYNKSTYGYYCNQSVGGNHAVTLVGWDDTFSKNNFKTKPSGNGAWIIKNSWGTWGKSGYFYISYYDKSLATDLAYQFDIEKADSDKRIYQYDGTFSDRTQSLYTTTHYEANNFTSQRDEYINRVGFFTPSSNTNYTIYIYKNNKSNDSPMSGDNVLEVSGNEPYSGFHTVDLSSPVFVNKGDKFSVVVKFTNSSSQKMYLDKSFDGGWYIAQAEVKSGQSYYTTGSKPTSTTWTSPSSANLRIKGYSNSVLLGSDKTYASFNTNKGIVIHSDATGLIGKIESITVGGKDVSFTPNGNEAYVSNAALAKAGLSDGKYDVVINTSDDFTKTFSVTIQVTPVNYTYLAFTSDVHDNSSKTCSTRLTNWLNGVSEKLDGALFDNFGICGDLGDAGASSTSYWTYAGNVINAIQNNNNVMNNGFFVCGNHEYSPGQFTQNKNDTTKKYSLTGTVYNDPNGKYVLYSFGVNGWDGSTSNYEIKQSDIDNLDAYLMQAPTDRPIFILSHYPLHNDGTRQIKGMGETIDVLNRYGDDHTIIFLWGHNHTDAGGTISTESHYDKVYEGSIPNYDNKQNEVAINFIYCSAGCMSDDENRYGSKYVLGKGLVAKIENGTVALSYYDKSNNLVGSTKTITYKTGTPQSTKYTITFDGNGGTPSSTTKQVVKNSTYGALPTATRTGYTFAGWYTDDTEGTLVTADTKAAITSNKTLYAHWTPITYTIKFSGNGATSGSMTSQTLTYGISATLKANAFVRTGYTFAGWTGSDGKTYEDKQSVENLTSTSGATITLTAKWTPIEYTITYELNGGTNSSSNPAKYTAEKAVTLSNPTKTGYTFGGWYKESGFTTKVTSIAQGSTGDLTLYAKWTAQEYTITYNLNSGTNNTNNPTKYTVEKAVTLYDPTRKGYTFEGWYKESTYKNKVESIALGSTGNISLYAKWSLTEYTITYDLDDGQVSSNNPTKYTITTATFTLNNPTKTGYTFDGWSGTGITGKSTSVRIAQGSTGDRTYTANFTPITSVKYTVKHYKQSLSGTYSSTPDETETKYGAFRESVTPAVKDNYTGFTAPATQTKTIADDGSTVFEYKYTRNSYTLTVNKGNGINTISSSNTYKYGASVSLSATAKTGYSTITWSGDVNTNSFTMPAKDISVTASAAPIQYKITYYLNSGTNNSQNPSNYTVEDEITLLSPTRSGYTFAGWYKESTFANKVTTIAKGSTGALSLYAKWEQTTQPVTLTSISVSNPQILYPKKSTSLNNVVVMANYSDGSSKNVTSSATITTPDMSTNGKKTVNVSYSGKTTSYSIYVFGTSTVSLNLEGRIIINYYTTYPNYDTVGYTPGVLFFKQENVPSTSDIKAAYNNKEGITKFETRTTDGVTNQVFQYDKLAAKEMNDTVYIVLYAVKGSDVVFGQPQGYSVAKYKDSIFNSYQENKFKTLVVDMLNYGAAAQSLFNYRTNELANSTITSSQSSYGTKTTPSIKKQNVAIKDSLSSDKIKISTVSLSLENEISINYYSSVTGNVRSAELLVFDSYTSGKTYNANTASRTLPVSSTSSGYCGSLTNIVAKEMRKRFYCRLHVTFTDGTQAYGDIINYSVEDYLSALYNQTNQTQATKNFVIAMMRYGDTAYNCLP